MTIKIVFPLYFYCILYFTFKLVYFAQKRKKVFCGFSGGMEANLVKTASAPTFDAFCLENQPNDH